MKIYTQPEGFVRNPLAKAKHGNIICPCGSGKKVKKCCGQYGYMKPELAKLVQADLDGDKKTYVEMREKIKVEKALADEKQRGTSNVVAT